MDYVYVSVIYLVKDNGANNCIKCVGDNKLNKLNKNCMGTMFGDTSTAVSNCKLSFKRKQKRTGKIKNFRSTFLMFFVFVDSIVPSLYITIFPRNQPIDKTEEKPQT